MYIYLHSRMSQKKFLAHYNLELRTSLHLTVKHFNESVLHDRKSLISLIDGKIILDHKRSILNSERKRDCIANLVEKIPFETM